MKCTNDDDFVNFCVVILIGKRFWDDIIMWKFVGMNTQSSTSSSFRKHYTVQQIGCKSNFLNDVHKLSVYFWKMGMANHDDYVM